MNNIKKTKKNKQLHRYTNRQTDRQIEKTQANSSTRLLKSAHMTILFPWQSPHLIRTLQSAICRCFRTLVSTRGVNTVWPSPSCWWRWALDFILG